MKYIISDSQYNKILLENRSEFPGIEFFGGNWKLVDQLISNFTFDGDIYSSMSDLFSKVIDSIIKDSDFNIEGYSLDYMFSPIRVKLFIDTENFIKPGNGPKFEKMVNNTPNTFLSVFCYYVEDKLYSIFHTAFDVSYSFQ